MQQFVVSFGVRLNTKRRLTLVLALSFFAILLIVTVSFFRSPSDPDRLLRETIRTAKSNDRAGTISRLEVILQEWPDHAATLFERVSYATSEEEALQFLARIRHGPPSILARARFQEGNLLLKQNRCWQAIESFREAIRNSPNATEPRERLIPWLSLLRRPEEVREQLQALRDLRGLSLAEMALWITADGRLTPFEEAEIYLKSFLAADPDDTASLKALSLYLAEESREPEALELLRKALRQDPGDPELSALLGRLLINSLKIPEAAEVLSGLGSADHFTTETWETIGLYAFAIQQHDTAKKTHAFVARQTPFERSRAYQMFRVLTALGQSEEAKVWRERSELLNTLHAEVETVGVAISRRIMDPRPVGRIAEILRHMELPAESLEWKQMLASMNRNGSPRTNADTASEATAGQLISPDDTSEHPPFNRDEAGVAPPVAEWAAMRLLLANNRPASVSSDSPVAESKIRLQDRTPGSGMDMKYDNGNTGYRYLIESMGGGVMILDFDHDGWPDVYFPQGGPLGEKATGEFRSDQVFRNLRNLQFAAVTDQSAIHEPGYSLGGAVGDVDGDGFEDIFVANYGRNTLFLNRGDGTFEEATDRSGLGDVLDMSSSAAFADLDGDGDLDLYVVNYVDGLRICRNDRQEIAACNPSSHEAVPDTLYENRGDGTFVNRSEYIRLDDSAGKGLGIVVSRLDHDLRPDIFIANDTTPNLLFWNHSQPGGMQFSESGFSAGVAVNGTGLVLAGMGVACADLDRDLRMDLYITNFHREANSLFLQKDPGLFQDLTTSAGLREPTLPRLGFGTQAADFDLDGWSELFVTNGHIDDQRALGVEWQMAPQLFATSDGRQWTDISLSTGEFFSEKALGRGVAIVDANRDGLPDIISGFQDRPAALLINETASPGNCISLQLAGTVGNRSALNAVVYWEVTGQRMRAEICGGNGYMCSNERRIRLALGSSTAADTVEIHWQDGEIQKQEQVVSGHYLVLQGHPFRTDPH